MSALDEYRKELNKGAAKRDSKLWLEYDVEVKIEDIFQSNEQQA